MGKQIIIGIILLGIGIGGGFGMAYMRYQTATTDLQTQIDDLKTEKKQIQDASDEKLNSVGRQLADAKAKVQASQTNAIRLSKENNDYKLKIKALMAQLARAGSTASTSAAIPTSTSTVRTASRPVAPAVPTTTRITTATRPETATTPTETTTATREYTVQQGENLWTIAEKELDNGMRYKEIIELNPPLTDKSVLAVGRKLKLPVK